MSRKNNAIASIAAAVALAAACSDQSVVTSPDNARSGRLSTVVSPCSASEGQQLIDGGQYKQAIREFTCVIGLDPTAVEGYRGRIEAELLMGNFSDALRDYARVTAFVEPVHPDAEQVIVAGYEARLKAAPDAVSALMGQSFAYWYFFDYAAAIHVLDHLVEVDPNSVYGNLFLGSSRFLRGRTTGAEDLERAIALAPSSPDVHFIVADAYTYGAAPDAQRAFDEATFALDGGLNTPRVHAILASSYFVFGDLAAAAAEIETHIDLVTTELIGTTPLASGKSISVPLVPGRVYEVPIEAVPGETISIATSSKDFYDTILVLLAPDGTAVVGSDDYKNYFAGFQWAAPAGGTYKLRVTSFEGINTGTLLVARD